jgi:hypothetical protein
MKRPTPKSTLALAAAPLTAVVLAVMGGYSLASMRVGGNEVYLREVKTAIEALPTTIGGHFSSEQPPIEAAVELLRPNKLMQREYTNSMQNSSFTLLVVHCADVRDMMGHYPPRCYPSNGWDVVEARDEVIERAGGSPIPITRYRVTLDHESGRFARVIANTFIVPRADDPLGRDDRALDRVTRTRWSSGLGAAQVQIITDASMDPEQRAEIERKVAEALDDLIETIAQAPQSGEDQK